MCPRQLTAAFRAIGAELGRQSISMAHGSAGFWLAPGSCLIVSPESAGRLRFDLSIDREPRSTLWARVDDLPRIKHLARWAQHEANLQTEGVAG